MTMTNLGKWDRWYSLLAPGGDPEPYGDSPTYALAGSFLADCATVEDWGCGKGWMRRMIDPGKYVGVDGSASPFADVIADLAGYRSDVDGIVLRHVLEHDHRWAQILTNAASSFRVRLVVVLFTPMTSETGEIAWNEDPGVPDISFAMGDLLDLLPDDVDVETLTIDSPDTQYETETMLLVQRRPR